MFGISFNELLVVFVVVVLFVRPSDIPSIIKKYKKIIKSATKCKRSVENYFVDIHNQVIETDPAETSELKLLDKSGYVLDDEGKFHKSYNIEDLKKKKH